MTRTSTGGWRALLLKPLAISLWVGSTFHAIHAEAQEWSQTYGDGMINEGRSMQVTSDGGFILLGFTYAQDNFSADVLLIKTDEFGTEEWIQT
jgi:hypothetical protein